MKSNFNPNIWGPKAWFFIDTIILSYPNNPSNTDKTLYKNFLYQLKDVLPCESCRSHYSNNINDIPLSSYYLNSRSNLIEWIIKIHNKVNIKNNKRIISKNDFIQYYMDSYNCDINLHNNDEIKTSYNYMTLILVIITICIILCIVHKKIEK